MWRSQHPDRSPERLKQNLFTNLHLAHVETPFELGCITREHVAAAIKGQFSNKHYQEFWIVARKERADHIGDASEKARAFHELCENAYNEVTKSDCSKK